MAPSPTGAAAATFPSSADRRRVRSLTRFAWLYIAAALATIALKGGAYVLTGSVGLLSDALESVVNLAAAMMTLAMLALAARPPDEEHAYGHGKAEYFASGLEGALIFAAALTIGIAAWPRLVEPRPIAQAGAGLAIAAAASALNFAVARLLRTASRRHDSIALEANARHLMTDVWTSAGVIAGVAFATVTGYHWIDPLLALAVAAHILISGAQLLRRSALGLLDTALPGAELADIERVLAPYRRSGIAFHALRTRQAGARRFVSLHVLVPGDWTVQRGHELLEEIEEGLRGALANVTVFTHLEPIEDPVSFEDRGLERRREVRDGGSAS
jgi:cation diffusion facilitator family transporter